MDTLRVLWRPRESITIPQWGAGGEDDPVDLTVKAVFYMFRRFNFGATGASAALTAADFCPRAFAVAGIDAESLAKLDHMYNRGGFEQLLVRDRHRVLVDWPKNRFRALLVLSHQPQMEQLPRLGAGFKFVVLPPDASRDEYVRTLTASDVYAEHAIPMEVRQGIVRKLWDQHRPTARAEWAAVVLAFVQQVGVEVQVARLYKASVAGIGRERSASPERGSAVTSPGGSPHGSPTGSSTGSPTGSHLGAPLTSPLRLKSKAPPSGGATPSLVHPEQTLSPTLSPAGTPYGSPGASPPGSPTLRRTRVSGGRPGAPVSPGARTPSPARIRLAAPVVPAAAGSPGTAAGIHAQAAGAGTSSPGSPGALPGTPGTPGASGGGPRLRVKPSLSAMKLPPPRTSGGAPGTGMGSGALISDSDRRAMLAQARLAVRARLDREQAAIDMLP